MLTRDSGTGEALQEPRMCSSMTSLLTPKKDLKLYVGLMHGLNAFTRWCRRNLAKQTAVVAGDRVPLPVRLLDCAKDVLWGELIA